MSNDTYRQFNHSGFFNNTFVPRTDPKYGDYIEVSKDMVNLELSIEIDGVSHNLNPRFKQQWAQSNA